jgi:hypothetical protein
MEMSVRTVYGKTVTINTDNVVCNSVQVGNDYYHLSKLFDENGNDLMRFAWRN